MNRICQIIIAGCLPLILCAPAGAQHVGPYAGAFVGGSSLADARGSDDKGDVRLTFDPGFAGSAVLGWDFEAGNPVGEGRVELEYTRRSNPLKKVEFVEGSRAGGGSVTADSLLLNAFGVFHDSGRWAPYVGGGLGAARVEATDMKASGQPFVSGSAIVFAYQLGIGVDVALTEHLNLDLGYRFFGSIAPNFTEVGGRKLAVDYFSHNVVLGLRVGF